MLAALSFVVSGRVVQTDLCVALEAQALSLRLTGWCREDYDTVAGTVQGEAAALKAFQSWLEGGFPGARIDAVEWSPSDTRPERTTFRWQVQARRD